MGLCAMSLGSVVDVVVERSGRLSLTPKPACAVNDMIRRTDKRNKSGGRTLGTKVHSRWLTCPSRANEGC